MLRWDWAIQISNKAVALLRDDAGSFAASGQPERTARRVLNEAIASGLLDSDTPKGAVSLRFPVDAQEIVFPRLFPES